MPSSIIDNQESILIFLVVFTCMLSAAISGPHRIDIFFNHVNEIIDSWRGPNLEKLLNVCYWLSLTYNVTTGLKNARIVWLSGNLKVKKINRANLFNKSWNTLTCVCTHTHIIEWKPVMINIKKVTLYEHALLCQLDFQKVSYPMCSIIIYNTWHLICQSF